MSASRLRRIDHTQQRLDPEAVTAIRHLANPDMCQVLCGGVWHTVWLSPRAAWLALSRSAPAQNDWEEQQEVRDADRAAEADSEA